MQPSAPSITVPPFARALGGYEPILAPLRLPEEVAFASDAELRLNQPSRTCRQANLCCDSSGVIAAAIDPYAVTRPFRSGDKPEVEEYELPDANRALVEPKERRIRGAKVLRIG